MPSNSKLSYSALRSRGIERLPATAVALCLAVALAWQPSAVEAKAARMQDTCKDARAPFSKIKNFSTDQALKGAAIGGGAAVAATLLKSGRKSTGDILGALVAGAMAGGIAGYITSIEQDKRNKAELRSAIDQDFGPTMQAQSQLPGQLAYLGQCRRSQIAYVESAAGSGAMSGKDARRALGDIEKWIAKDDEVIAKAAGAQAKTITEYAQASAVANGVDAQTAQREGWAMDYYGLDVLGTQIEAQNAMQDASQYFVNAPSGARLRAGPTTASGVVGTLAHGSKIEATGTSSAGWVPVRTANGAVGYVNLDLLANTTPAAPTPRLRTDRGGAMLVSAAKTRRDIEETRQREQMATRARLSAARSLLAGA